MSPLELVLASVVMGAGALIQGSIGFGLNVVAAPVLVLIDPALVPVPTLVAALVLTVMVAVRERAGVAWAGVGWALLGRLPGTVGGALVVAAVSARTLGVAIAVAVLGAVVVAATGWHVPPSRGTLLTAGVLSGLFGTATSIGGPPMALLYQRASGATLRGTLSGFFAVGTLVSLVALAVVGRVGGTELTASAALLPGTVAGFAASVPVARRLDHGRLRGAVLVLCAASGLAVLAATLRG